MIIKYACDDNITCKYFEDYKEFLKEASSKKHSKDFIAAKNIILLDNVSQVYSFSNMIDACKFCMTKLCSLNV